MSLRRSSLVWLTCIAAACGSQATDPGAYENLAADAIAAGSVTAVATAAGIRVTNRTEAPIAYFVLERHTGALALWGPCVSPSPQCLRVAPGTSRVVPRSEIGGFDSRSTEATFWWWHLVPSTNGGLEPDTVRTILVRF